jgi:hypothetical protein
MGPMLKCENNQSFYRLRQLVLMMKPGLSRKTCTVGPPRRSVQCATCPYALLSQYRLLRRLSQSTIIQQPWLVCTDACHIEPILLTYLMSDTRVPYCHVYRSSNQPDVAGLVTSSSSSVTGSHSVEKTCRVYLYGYTRLLQGIPKDHIDCYRHQEGRHIGGIFVWT